MFRSLLSSLAAAMAIAPIGQDCFGADAPASFDRPERWGSPWLLTEPRYPDVARERGTTGVVDVEARVAGTGELKEIEVKPGSSGSEIFVDAVRDAAPFWRFYAPVGDDCLPKSARVTTRVWFELDKGKPRIFVSRGESPERPSSTSLKPEYDPRPRYPQKMIAAGRDAFVFARTEIDPSGAVVDVTATAFPREIAERFFDFEREVRRALGSWKFPAAPDGTHGSRFFCSDVVFRLGD